MISAVKWFGFCHCFCYFNLLSMWQVTKAWKDDSFLQAWHFNDYIQQSNLDMYIISISRILWEALCSSTRHVRSDKSPLHRECIPISFYLYLPLNIFKTTTDRTRKYFSKISSYKFLLCWIKQILRKFLRYYLLMSIAWYNQLWSILVYLWFSEIQKGLGISARLFGCGFRRPTKQSYSYSLNRLLDYLTTMKTVG